MNMNTNTAQDNWNDLKKMIKTKWSKFSDAEVDNFKDNLGRISSQVQKTYGIAKEEAEREFKEFKDAMLTKKTIGKKQS